jgi:hypothetical protein
MAFTVDIRGNASHLEKTLKSVKGGIESIGSIAAGSVAGLAALGAAGAAGLGAFIISSSKAASNVESLTMQFETLLGGADAAGKRMEEITKFAASTPFEIAELASTSKLLQTLGGDLLATGEGLRMVGDAAAISGQPIAEVGLHIGRVFNAITSGTSAGESIARLQELGLMSGTVKRQFEDLAAAQKKGDAQTLTSAQALAKLREVFASTDGAMARLAATTEGKLSNLGDNITQLKVAFGTGFNEGLKDALDATNNFLPQIEGKFRDIGNVVGDAISSAIAGDPEKLATIGAYAGTIFVEGFKAVFLKGMDELLASGLDKLKTEGLDPLGMYRMRDMMTGESRFEAPEKTQSAPLSGYMQTALENVANSEAGQRMNQMNLAQQVKYALENGGVKEGMSAAVRQGVFDAWKQQEAQRKSGAKFAN